MFAWLEYVRHGRLRGLVLLAAGWPALPLAGGPVHGARAAAMGTAFVGLADDASAFAYNPAGLALLGPKQQVYGGATLVMPATDFRNPSGLEESTEFQAFAPPHLYYLPKANHPDWRFGLGVFAPFGVGGRKWSSNGLTRYASTESLIGTLAVNPTLAGRLAPGLHAGFGFDLMMVRSLTRLRTDQSLLGAGDGRVKIKGSGAGPGYNFGLLYAPAEDWSLGAAYRSKIRVRLKGDLHLRNLAPPLQPLFGGAAFNSGISSPLVFPDILSLGLAYKGLRNATLTFDAEQIRWSSFRSQKLNLEREVPPAATDSTTPLRWRNVWTLRAGIEFRLAGTTALRAGYAYVPSPVPERTLSPAAPDGTMHHFSVGAGHRLRDGLALDVFYTLGVAGKRSVDNAILSGGYRNTTHYAGVSVTHAF
ncbi:MAG: outer membrane protein transport protein [Burkholderiales bacterium]|nr:outer membrane protein transport protein [Zoogloeaceae bacterium]MBV6411635.1 putative outer membrane protein [Rhodocyclaceae bacterium]MCZ2418896.1 outer membrane protein transport protein [Burkholderiales bacterium]HNQ56334.1 outer membrane protein transport protein [Candidatus Desulfobacillus denitrificans]HNT61642.1 outer membrane protein transport protein [Candidatus Desulfobacillus denitrificans]